jgi:hypothetical protein
MRGWCAWSFHGMPGGEVKSAKAGQPQGAKAKAGALNPYGASLAAQTL